MSTLASTGIPLDSLNAMRPHQARDAAIDKEQLKTSEDTEKVAKKFEALLVHNMLKAMRSTTLGDKPSNERAMYDDMFDKELASKLSESGGLGIATAISRQLNAQLGIDANQSHGQVSEFDKSMQNLSNHPNTLARNGKLSSAVDNISHYKALMNEADSVNQLQSSPYGSISSDSLRSVANADELPLGETKRQFIESLLPDAKRSAARLGIEPNIVVAIAALETGWGKHVIKDSNGASSHNLFGIKAHGKTTPYTMHKTTEYINNQAITVDEPFRRYQNHSYAVNDFADFLLTNPRYENALDAGADNHSFLHELQRAGYATDPEYANKAIEILRQIETIQQSPAL